MCIMVLHVFNINTLLSELHPEGCGDFIGEQISFWSRFIANFLLFNDINMILILPCFLAAPGIRFYVNLTID